MQDTYILGNPEDEAVTGIAKIILVMEFHVREVDVKRLPDASELGY